MSAKGVFFVQFMYLKKYFIYLQHTSISSVVKEKFVFLNKTFTDVIFDCQISQICITLKETATKRLRWVYCTLSSLCLEQIRIIFTAWADCVAYP